MKRKIWKRGKTLRKKETDMKRVGTYKQNRKKHSREGKVESHIKKIHSWLHLYFYRKNTEKTDKNC